MTAPGILPGGSTVFSQSASVIARGTTPRSNTGVFGAHPGATPKWALNRGPRDAEKRETMARLFIDVPRVARDRLLNSLPRSVQRLASVLTSTGYIDFLLTSANENLREKTQIVDTLTDSYVAFYSGQEPPVFQYGGTVLNTYQDDQRVWLFRLYQSILRGTRLANRNLVARLRYDSFVVSGYLEGLSNQLDGNMGRTSGGFTFLMRVKSVSVITPSLALPTVLETPATRGITFADPTAVQTDATERIGAATTETPPTANRRPAASSNTETDTREEASSPEDRVREQAAANAGNASEDAEGSLSNVRGRPPASVVEEARSGADTRRVSPRPRGTRQASAG